MFGVINSIQILNETFSKTIIESNDSLIKLNEDAIKSAHEKMGSIIEKINEIEKNLKDIWENVCTDTKKYFDEAKNKIMEVCDENINIMKNVWEEFNKIKEETKANSENILSLKQFLDNIQIS